MCAEPPRPPGRRAARYPRLTAAPEAAWSSSRSGRQVGACFAQEPSISTCRLVDTSIAATREQRLPVNRRFHAAPRRRMRRATRRPTRGGGRRCDLAGRAEGDSTPYLAPCTPPRRRASLSLPLRFCHLLLDGFRQHVGQVECGKRHLPSRFSCAGTVLPS